MQQRLKEALGGFVKSQRGTLGPSIKVAIAEEDDDIAFGGSVKLADGGEVFLLSPSDESTNGQLLLNFKYKAEHTNSDGHTMPAILGRWLKPSESVSSDEHQARIAAHLGFNVRSEDQRVQFQALLNFAQDAVATIKQVRDPSRESAFAAMTVG